MSTDYRLIHVIRHPGILSHNHPVSDQDTNQDKEMGLSALMWHLAQQFMAGVEGMGETEMGQGYGWGLEELGPSSSMEEHLKVRGAQGLEEQEG